MPHYAHSWRARVICFAALMSTPCVGFAQSSTIYTPGYSKDAKSVPSNVKLVPIGDLAEASMEKCQLTYPGATPFHLIANLVESTNRNSSYHAEIVEDWISPSKWRREIHSPGFSQQIVVNGNATFERDDGDYYPYWLKNFIVALFNPLPMLDQLKQLDRRVADPRVKDDLNTCLDLHFNIGRAIFCFEGREPRLESVFTPDYFAEFKDYKKFGRKMIARQIVDDPEPGTTLTATIKELGELSRTDESLYAIDHPTPPEEQINSVRVDESELRALALDSTEIHWPTVGKNPTTGRCGLIISVDRTGRTREVWPGGCDNSDLEDELRKQVSKWRFKPAVSNGIPVQVESFLTFTFNTQLAPAK